MTFVLKEQNVIISFSFLMPEYRPQQVETSIMRGSDFAQRGLNEIEYLESY